MNIRFFLAACAVVASLSHPTPGRAEAGDPETRALARELLDVIMMDDMQSKMIDGSWPQVEATIRQAAPQLTDDQIGELKSEYVGIVGKEMKTLLVGAPEIYARYLTASEIRDLLAFYRTETGKKTISIMPALMAEIMQKVQAQLPRMQQNLMTSFQRVLQQKGVKL